MAKASAMNSATNRQMIQGCWKKACGACLNSEHEGGAGGCVGQRHSLHVREREREAAPGRHLLALADDDARENRDHRQHARRERQQQADAEEGGEYREQVAVADERWRACLVRRRRRLARGRAPAVAPRCRSAPAAALAAERWRRRRDPPCWRRAAGRTDVDGLRNGRVAQSGGRAALVRHSSGAR